MKPLGSKSLCLALLILGGVTLSGQSLQKKSQNTKDLGFKVPSGFEVTLHADDALATDIHSLTIDTKGRIVVAGQGYIKTLHDTDGDGRADKATLFADFPKSGAHGMYFDGNDLICNGDGGVRRLYDSDGDGKCDKVSPVYVPTTNDTSHAANGIVRGPDGWYYLIAGNDAGISRKHINIETSPVRDPNAGVVVRFSPDGQQREVLAHGFRNPYDIAFNHLGHMFTVDADGERVHQMPYYAPNRLFDIALGMHHGWVLPGWKRGWSRPPWWPDNVERLVEIGRGSPTGVICYRHNAFPKRYHNGIFSLCWTFGRVYFFPLERDGSTYESKKEIFMHTTGDVGFAPTDMAVGPNGDLFVSIGGRGTRGSVFRVTYKGKQAPTTHKASDLHQVLRAPQPLSSWSRARWLPLAEKLGKKVFVNALTNAELALQDRLRAVEVLTELFGGIPITQAKKACQDAPPELQARVLWSLSRTSQSLAALTIMSGMTRSSDPRVARAAWEGLLSAADSFNTSTLKPDWTSGLESHDRRVRATALLAATGPLRKSFLRTYKDVPHEKLSAREALARLSIVEPDWKNSAQIKDCFDTCLTVCSQEKDPVVRLEAVRLLQIALGDVDTKKGLENSFIGYVARDVVKVDLGMRKRAAAELAGHFPSGDELLDCELARLLAMLEVEALPNLLDRLAKKWTKTSDFRADIHYLLVLGRLPGKRSSFVTEQTAAALNGIYVKLAARGSRPTDQVPGILEKVLQQFLKYDRNLAAAIVADPSYGIPGHELYAGVLPLAQKQAATRKLIKALSKLDEEAALLAWSPDLVRLVAALPESESLPILRAHFANPQLSDTIALILAETALPEDRGRMIAALDSMQSTVVGAAAKALIRMSGKKVKVLPQEIGAAVRALRRLGVEKAQANERAALEELLTYWIGKEDTKAISDPGQKTQAWIQWYRNTYPKEAAALPGLSAATFASWKERLEKLDWESGSVTNGKLVFQKQNCMRCHGGARRLGPDLDGVAQRFSRDDLFAAIIEPNKDISPAYRATAVVTNSGKVYSGMIIYASPALHLLQTTPDTTVRIPQHELQAVMPSSVSFMPKGLLDNLEDAELVDLYAYLKTLRKK